jgi:hypothetical protein
MLPVAIVFSLLSPMDNDSLLGCPVALPVLEIFRIAG